jgi:hypothetical protein
VETLLLLEMLVLAVNQRLMQEERVVLFITVVFQVLDGVN